MFRFAAPRAASGRRSLLVHRIARCAFLALWVLAVGARAEESGAGHPAMWRVRSATNSVWLFGSVHVARSSFYPLPDAVEAALDGAEVLAVEIDVAAASPGRIAEFQRSLTYEPPDGLDRHVKPSTWKVVEEFARTTGQSTSDMRRLKPMLLVTGLEAVMMSARGYEIGSGVDEYLLRSARRTAKRIVELESFELQARILADISDEEGDLLVSATLEGLRSGEFIAEFEALLEAWRQGDTARMERIVLESDMDPLSVRMNRQLFGDRNRAMADKIENLLREGRPAMVVVGAGHFVGADGIVELLKADGLPVERVNYVPFAAVSRPVADPETAR